MVLAFATLLLQLSGVPQAAIQPAGRPAQTVVESHEKSPVATPREGAEAKADSSLDSTAADTHGTKASAAAGPSFQPTAAKTELPASAGESAANRDLALESDQLGQGISTIRVPEIKNPGPHNIEQVEVPSRKTWLALAFVEHGAATFDAYSTRQAISKGAVEDDPLMRPFAHSDAMYAAAQVTPFLFDYLARRMQRSDNMTFRRFWWLPQSVSTGVSVFAGVHNLHVANSLSK